MKFKSQFLLFFLLLIFSTFNGYSFNASSGPKEKNIRGTVFTIEQKKQEASLLEVEERYLHGELKGTSLKKATVKTARLSWLQKAVINRAIKRIERKKSTDLGACCDLFGDWLELLGEYPVLALIIALVVIIVVVIALIV